MYVFMYDVLRIYVCTWICMYVGTYVGTYVCISCDSYNKYLLFPHTILNYFSSWCTIIMFSVKQKLNLTRNSDQRRSAHCSLLQKHNIYQKKYFKVLFPSLIHLLISKYFLERKKSIWILNKNYHLK